MIKISPEKEVALDRLRSEIENCKLLLDEIHRKAHDLPIDEVKKFTELIKRNAQRCKSVF